MITIHSIYDYKSFKVFQRYSLQKIFILSYICALALVGIGVWFAFDSRSSYIVYILSGILLPFVLHISYKLLELENINKNVLLRDTTAQIFTFDQEGFTLEQIAKQGTFKEKYVYDDILSIVKYKRYYFIYINRVQAFVVVNDNYLLGNEEELDELFKTIKKDKFIVKRNSGKVAR